MPLRNFETSNRFNHLRRRDPLRTRGERETKRAEIERRAEDRKKSGETLPSSVPHVTTTRIINPRIAVPCTYLPVITIFLFNILSISPVSTAKRAFSPWRIVRLRAFESRVATRIKEHNAYAGRFSFPHARGVNRRIYVRFDVRYLLRDIRPPRDSREVRSTVYRRCYQNWKLRGFTRSALSPWRYFYVTLAAQDIFSAAYGKFLKTISKEYS